MTDKELFMEEFNNGLHRLGRITMLSTMIILTLVPFVFGAIYGVNNASNISIIENNGSAMVAQLENGNKYALLQDAIDAAELKDVKGEVTLEDVTFGYTADKTVLKNVSVNAKKGQTVAIVGPTGAGKTTITNLLNRFYDIAEGEITIDGKLIKVTSDEINEKYNNDEFCPVDGELIRGCDHLSAYLEAYLSIKYGINSEQMQEGYHNLFQQYENREIGSVDFGQLFDYFRI